jgi:hypothetical protein
MKLFCCTLFLLFASGVVANAQQHPIDISSVANANWCTAGAANCTTLPFGTQAYDGVTFHIPGTASTDNFWFSRVTADNGNGKVSVTIPIKIANVKTVYTLMNTDWGSAETGLLSIAFNGTNGATWTYDPLGNVNIRDYNNGSFTNTIDCALPSGPGNGATVSAFNNGKGQRLDMQIYELPQSFTGQTLESITITDSGSEGVQRSFLAALTVSTNAP